MTKDHYTVFKYEPYEGYYVYCVGTRKQCQDGIKASKRVSNDDFYIFQGDGIDVDLFLSDAEI